MKNGCEWKPSYIFPNEYLVSNDGQVKSVRNNKILKPTEDKDGYLYFVLCVNGNRKTIKAHRLVAKTFIENPCNKPAVDHINGIKHDNRVENLRWVTNKENTNNPITLEKIIKSGKKRLPKMIEESKRRDFGRIKTVVYKENQKIGEFNSEKEAAEKTGVSPGKVSQCVLGKMNKCKGYTFKRIGEYVNDEEK
jgi:hypothetical protein